MHIYVSLNKSKQDKNGNGKDIINFFVALGTLGLAFFSWWQGCEVREQTKAIIGQESASQRQADAAERQNRLSDSTAVRQLRAYVGLILNDTTQYAEYGKEDSATHFASFSIKNFGQTPASHVTVVGRDSVMPNSPDNIFDTIPRGIGSESSIFPSDGTTKVTFLKTWSASQLRRIKKGKSIYYIWGIIRYTDAFGYRHGTTFRYEVGRGRGEMEFTAITPSSEGNNTY